MNITNNEKSMLISIAESEYSPVNGAIPSTKEETGTYVFDIVETNSDKGVLSSLVKKQLVNVWDDDDNTVYFTNLGWETYLEIKEK